MTRARNHLAHVPDRYETQLAFAALIGPDGNVLAGSGPGSVGLKAADRDHFRIHVRSDSGLPHIGGRIAPVPRRAAAAVAAPRSTPRQRYVQ
jgi:hypothetical protein